MEMVMYFWMLSHLGSVNRGLLAVISDYIEYNKIESFYKFIIYVEKVIIPYNLENYNSRQQQKQNLGSSWTVHM